MAELNMDTFDAQRLATEKEIETIATKHLDLDLVEEDYMHVSVGEGLNGNGESDNESTDSSIIVQPKTKVMPDLGSESMFPSLGSTAPKSLAGWGSKNASQSVSSNSSARSPISPQVSNVITQNFTLKLPQTSSVSSQLRETIQRVQKRCAVTINVSSSRLNETSTFIIKGRPEHVAKAEREIRASLSPKVNVTANVPLSVIRFVLGTKGRNLAIIQQRTMTTIEVPRREEDTSEEDIDLPVKITGDFSGVQQAKKEIESIVREKESRKEIKITDIPLKYYPLIAGINNSRVKSLFAGTGIEVKVPFLVGLSSQEIASVDTSITVYGTKSDAENAVIRIQEFYNEFIESVSELDISIHKAKHRFLIGPNGKHFLEILENSGCIVILPDAQETSDKITVCGPSSSLPTALTIVMKKAETAQVGSLDMAAIHKLSPDFRQNLFAYLEYSSLVGSLESTYQVQIHLPTIEQKNNKISIVGADKNNVSQVLTSLGNKIKSVTPSLLTSVNIPTELHGFVAGPQGEKKAKIEASHDVDIIFPAPQKFSSRVLIIAKSSPQSLSSARASLEKSVSGKSDIEQQLLKVPAKVHRHLIGPNGTTLERLTGPPGESLVHVTFGSKPQHDEKRPSHLSSSKLESDQILVRGSAKEVSRIHQELLKLAKEMEDYETASAYYITFTIPSKQSSHVVGKGGANINRIKDTFDVKVDCEIKGGKDETSVRIQGLKKNVDAAKEDIFSLVEKLKDQTEERLRVPNQYHSSIIGTKGRYVKRLEEKYGVRLRFPRNENINSDEDDEDKIISPSGRDEIHIRGGRKGVAEAKAEILELVEYERDNGHKIQIRVERKFLPHILGRSGSSINEIKDETNTRIDIDRESDPEATITIQGTKVGTKEAQKAILAIVSEVESIVSQDINIPNKYHRALIGTGGSKLRALVAKCQGLSPSDPDVQANMVRFPRSGDKDVVAVKGNKDLVVKVCAALEEATLRLEEIKTIKIDIDPQHHALLIGRGGSNLREIMEKHSVDIHFPRRNTKGDSASEITISGKEEACEAAKAILLSQVPKDEKIDISYTQHLFLLASNRASPRRLRTEYNVSVDCPEASVPNFVSQSSQVARIDDDKPMIACHIAEIPEFPTEVSWVLKGSAPAVAKARIYLDKQLAFVKLYDTFMRIFVPSSSHRLLVGRNGSTINQLRSDTGCEIELPPNSKNNRNDNNNSFSDRVSVLVMGPLNQVNAAHARILEIVNSGREQKF